MINTNSVALLVIDVQVAFELQDAQGAQRNNPTAESKIAYLLQEFRQRQLPVFHIHHHSLEQHSLLRAELPGSAVQLCASPQADEPVYIKHANAAFIGTTLESDLRQQGIDTVVCCGATGNHCVETTTRMAGNLGFSTFFVEDAVWTYAASGPDGKSHTAEEILSVTICNLHGEFATVISSSKLIALLG